MYKDNAHLLIYSHKLQNTRTAYSKQNDTKTKK